MLTLARAFAVEAHGAQRYGTRPYADHLDEVAAILQPHGETAIAVGYLHDVLEDTAVAPDELDRIFGELVGRCVRLLTDPPGASREARKAETWRKLRAIPRGAPEEIALLVKTADRLANVRACLRDDPGGKLAMYRREHQAFRAAVLRPASDPTLWHELDQALA
ncbi:MAG: bifunctional (p)ppGpp synthetase/guanosine-3',5'-bis(diphosphate) 3'-pyrophosphohydrolase [Rhodospirillales bacterium]|nr:bifunctional (p)ppGpp synthetase/guanosine-3',5'-bis(diphosphate) 3'-pyrophosphohydrolase [Rhodospirillales bacterium]